MKAVSPHSLDFVAARASSAIGNFKFSPGTARHLTSLYAHCGLGSWFGDDR